MVDYRIPDKGTCKVRLFEPPPCYNPTRSELYSWIMCHAWYKIPEECKDEDLATKFGDAVRQTWEDYNFGCTGELGKKRK